jgi:uncharacterized protein Usg
LEGDGEVIANGVKISEQLDINTDVAFFYGDPDLGQNFVWKDFDTDPSIFVNTFHKVKNFLKTLKILTR